MPITNYFGSLQPGEKLEAVRDAYKKHSTELLALEEAQQKFTLLLLAILGAGASFIGAQKDLVVGYGPRIGLTLVVGGIALFGVWYTRKRDAARTATRRFMVACEEALGFWGNNAHVGGVLYPGAAQNFIDAGGWLSAARRLVLIAGIGFLTLLWTLPYAK